MNIIEKLGITPSPWERDGYDIYQDALDYGITIAADRYIDTRNEGVANARLIATAPEMLESMLEMAEDICRLCRYVNPQHKDCSECDDMNSHRNVIEKATGKTWQEIQALL